MNSPVEPVVTITKPPVLDVERVSLSFGGVCALSEVSLHVAPGEIVAVIGPNGAGKTSLFNVISGLYRPQRGSVRIGGVPPVLPFDAARIRGVVLVALGSALAAILAWNLLPLWETAVRQQARSFTWSAAGAAVARQLSAATTLLPAGLGLLLGGGAALLLTARARRGPEAVVAAGVARTFQNIRLFPGQSVLAHVLIGMHAQLKAGFWQSAIGLAGREERTAVARARDLLAFVGLAGCEAQAATSLPYGHQRRLEIARALASAPRLLLLDEPAAGMNASESQDLMALIRRIRTRGIAVMLIEHDMQVVFGVSDRVVVLHHGCRHATGTPDAVRCDPAVIAAYLGGCPESGSRDASGGATS